MKDISVSQLATPPPSTKRSPDTNNRDVFANQEVQTDGMIDGQFSSGPGYPELLPSIEAVSGPSQSSANREEIVAPSAEQPTPVASTTDFTSSIPVATTPKPMLESDAKLSGPAHFIAAPTPTISAPKSQETLFAPKEGYLSPNFVSMFDLGAPADEGNTDAEYMCRFCRKVAPEAADIQHPNWCDDRTEPQVYLVDASEKRRRQLIRNANSNLPDIDPRVLLEESRWNEELKLMCVCGEIPHDSVCPYEGPEPKKEAAAQGAPADDREAAE